MSGVNDFLYPYKNMKWKNYSIDYFRGQSIILSNGSDCNYKFNFHTIKPYERDYIVYSNEKNYSEVLENIPNFSFDSVPVTRIFQYTDQCLLGWLHTKFDEVKYINIDNILIKLNKERTFSKYQEELKIEHLLKVVYKKIDEKIYNCSHVFFSMLEWMRVDFLKTWTNIQIIDYINKKHKKKVIVGGIKDLVNKIDVLKDNFQITGNNLNELDIAADTRNLSNSYTMDQLLYEVEDYDSTSLQDIAKSYGLQIKAEGTLKHLLFSLTDSYGCKGNCAFCGSALLKFDLNKELLYKKFEQLRIYSELGYNSLMFLDSTISTNEVFYPLVEYFQKHNLKYDILTGFRLIDVTKEKIKLCEEIGIKILNLGIETVDEKHRKFIRKGLSDSKMFQQLDIIKDSNIFTFGNFIFKMPYCIDNEAQKTLEFVNNHKDLINDYICGLYFCADESPFIEQKRNFNIHTYNMKGFKLYSEDNRKNSFYKVYSSIADDIPNILSSGINVNNFYRCLTHFVFMLYKEYEHKNFVVQKYNEILENLC